MKILILADDPVALRLSAVLESLGETVVHSTASGDVDAVIKAGDAVSQHSVLARLPSSTPIIEMLDSPSAVVASGVIPLQIPETLPYQSLLDVLARVQHRGPESVDDSVDDGLVGSSLAIIHLRSMLHRVADKSVTVLITGPSGAGKELVARNLHRLSPRCNGPFVPVNCGAIPRELLESELFGHEKGAFTGAISSRAGRFELAAGGTLFLDEIGDMPLDMQVKILRVIQERRFERVGSSVSQEADVRIVAATHRDLEAMIGSGDFREDLYYRLNVFPIEVPALDARREDIPLLINRIVVQLEAEGLGLLRLTPAAIAALSQASWSGNIRELANLLERLLIMHADALVGVADLPEKYRPDLDVATTAPVSIISAEQPLDLKLKMQEMEKTLISEALSVHHGVVSRTAGHLGLRRTTLIEKMRKLDIPNR
ncbi:response regulator with CheY-like receiver, AAA-type ATPase, and DNA-binding domains [Spongiibacter sp. IMCC21906]|uniref:sigma-54 dependent transcriptional regulator n=1 Tax=Spongiibacter sp. IMCC21906 TaxID=1620392 RepID=UPI00062DD44D|nr:sigma-54 dependent transcriptional regulator [Spongiibacter sp. IMCC21906]AKH70172.1 response regulator with CheY-like receiver, AAA-type ATPase, and DNA-binding domains [Spongiibacter sp. IMCC21906]